MNANGDGEELVFQLVLGLLVGAFCGAVPLVVGLLRGNKSMAWTGFGISILLGVTCSFVALIPAIAFTIIIAVTEPIEKRKKRGKKRRRRERADDFLEDGPRRKKYEDDDDRPRRRRRYEDDDDDDYDDRPRRRR